MSLESQLQNLRSKPDHIRKQYAFWSSFGLTAVIFTFWLGSFGSIKTQAPGSLVTAAVNDAGTPVESLAASVGAFFVDIKDMVFGPRKITYSTVEVKPGK